jgi:hypothetical protein
MTLIQPISQRRTRIALAVAMILTLASGCHNSSMEPEVTGTVKLDGKPIGPGTIVFVPTEQGRKPVAGSVESDGSYDLKPSRMSGLSSGQYRVAVSIREMPRITKRGDRPPVGKLLTPEKYEDETKSGLQYQLEAGRNTLDIELASR